ALAERTQQSLLESAAPQTLGLPEEVQHRLRVGRRQPLRLGRGRALSGRHWPPASSVPRRIGPLYALRWRQPTGPATAGTSNLWIGADRPKRADLVKRSDAAPTSARCVARAITDGLPNGGLHQYVPLGAISRG